MVDKYLLVLVALDEDMRDVTGTVYPDDGFVRAGTFVEDQDIRTGLNGILWGAADNLSYFSSERKTWVIVKLSETANFIALDEASNIIKFKEGFVVHCGSLESASNYIANYWLEQIPGETGVIPAQVIGFKDEADLPNKHALASGAGGEALSKVGGLHAIVTSQDGKSITHQVESHAIALGHRGQASTIGDSTVAISAGDEGVVRTCGQNSKAVSLDKSSKAFSTGYDSVSVCLETDGMAAAGVNGALIMAYEEEGRRRFAVGYVGEDVISNRMYRCEDGKFVLIH